MKTRILFIDDDLMVLQSLQRVLYPMQAEWDMEFVDSGAKALARMAETPFDIVITDMLMPGMNGAQLLDEVMKRYPATIRFILSGHANAEDIFKCISSTTHQFFSKPVDVDALKTAVQDSLLALHHGIKTKTLTEDQVAQVEMAAKTADATKVADSISHFSHSENEG